jgi:hypothetical protein
VQLRTQGIPGFGDGVADSKAHPNTSACKEVPTQQQHSCHHRVPQQGGRTHRIQQTVIMF